jgi:circadian clock protein KaiB
LRQPAKGRSKAKNSQVIQLHLYIAGNAPNSVAAISNLGKICSEHSECLFDLEVIDLMKDPSLAVRHEILATPTLVRNLPLPIRKVVGNLSDTEKVLVGLNIRKHKT